MAPTPARLRWAVDVLAIQPNERILEIGCGRGIAMDLVCERLHDGSITGLDRSPAAIAAAATRNEKHIRAGKARLLKAALADAELDERFDKAFAVNVNVFWLAPAKELAVIRRSLAPRGRLYLFYEPPSTSQLERAAQSCHAFLEESGYAVLDILRVDLPPHRGLCLVAAA